MTVASGAAGLAFDGHIAGLDIDPSARGVTLTFRLQGGLPSRAEARLNGGIEIAFEYVAQLRRRRRLVDSTVSERYIVVTASYSNLTKMYKLTRRVDGTVTDSELTDREAVMRSWMCELPRLELFDQRDLRKPGEYYVRVKGKLERRLKMLFIPASLETDWAESERFVHGEGD